MEHLSDDINKIFLILKYSIIRDLKEFFFKRRYISGNLCKATWGTAVLILNMTLFFFKWTFKTKISTMLHETVF